MRKLILLHLLIGLVNCCFSQSDFLVLRKKNATIQSFFKGSYIQCRMGESYWIEGRIKAIKKDSIYIEQMAIRQVPNYWGLPSIDTLRMGILKIVVSEITAFPLKNEHFTFIKNGQLFQLGSALYAGLNVLNGLTTDDNDLTSNKNIKRLSIAGIVFLMGKILQWQHPKAMVIGKKYKLYSTATMIAN
ncbi:MAG: hypothetical protein ACOVNY_01380 [Chitinophagaceae bacterium]